MTEDLGINIWTPIWHQDPEQHMTELIDFGFEVMITGFPAKVWMIPGSERSFVPNHIRNLDIIGKI